MADKTPTATGATLGPLGNGQQSPLKGGVCGGITGLNQVFGQVGSLESDPVVSSEGYGSNQVLWPEGSLDQIRLFYRVVHQSRPLAREGSPEQTNPFQAQ